MRTEEQIQQYIEKLKSDIKYIYSQNWIGFKSDKAAFKLIWIKTLEWVIEK